MIQKMQKMMSKKNKKGFTLIELIVVIAIIAILAAIAIPRLAGSRDAAQLRADQATGRTIMSAVSIAEATYGGGSNLTVARVNEFLDGQLGSGTLAGWSVDLSTNPIQVTGPRGIVNLTATP